MTNDTERTYDELLATIPRDARPEVAQARNHHARATDARNVMMENSARFRVLVIRLYAVHGVSKKKMARLFGLSRSQIQRIIGPAVPKR